MVLPTACHSTAPHVAASALRTPSRIAGQPSKASENASSGGTENKLAFARQFYNDSVNSLNNSVQSFPSNIIAGMFGFRTGAYFEVPEVEKAAPKVDLR